MDSCLQRQNDISGCNGIFHCIADSGKPQSFGVLILIHASISTQIDIFTMVKKRHATFCRDPHCFFTKRCIHHRFTILGHCRDPCFHHSGNICKFSTLFSHGGCTCLKYMNTGNLRRLVMYIVYPVRIINSGSCIWHSNYSCHTTTCCRSSTTLDIFLMCLARITKMDMKIDNSRHDQLSFRIDHTVAVFLFQLLAYFRNDSVFQINIACFIRICSRIHDPASSNQNPHFCSPLILYFQSRSFNPLVFSYIIHEISLFIKIFFTKQFRLFLHPGIVGIFSLTFQNTGYIIRAWQNI